jgi:hypothetical protein
VQLIAVYANFSIQFGEWTPLCLILVKTPTNVCKTTPFYRAVASVLLFHEKKANGVFYLQKLLLQDIFRLQNNNNNNNYNDNNNIIIIINK